MKRRLADLLVCPFDRTPLELAVWESGPVTPSAADGLRIDALGLTRDGFGEEIETGVLINRARGVFYPIHAGVPRMLTFPTRVANAFAERHAARMASELRGLRLPDGEPTPGEETVLRTFSSEWVGYDWDGQSYWNVEPQLMFESMKFMLDTSGRPLTGKRVLEVGIGIGGIADNLARTEGCELVGVDLGYAVDAAYKHFGRNLFLHIVQASAFAPPFADQTFDLVYSQGVIHHTYSTRAAFDSIARLPKQGGRLYIWVYSPYDEERTATRRVLMMMERIIRPLAWRLPEKLQKAVLAPVVLLYLIHQNLGEAGKNGRIRYGWREALHAARDRFTPRFVHRHTDEEVTSWFREAGYRDLVIASQRKRPEYVPIAFVTCAGVDGVRASV